MHSTIVYPLVAQHSHRTGGGVSSPSPPHFPQARANKETMLLYPHLLGLSRSLIAPRVTGPAFFPKLAYQRHSRKALLGFGVASFSVPLLHRRSEAFLLFTRTSSLVSQQAPLAATRPIQRSAPPHTNAASGPHLQALGLRDTRHNLRSLSFIDGSGLLKLSASVEACWVSGMPQPRRVSSRQREVFQSQSATPI